ncbi:MAG TPA: radical SAM protein [Candidatus Dormibacteraeota bacterium]|nr:radical SAM protein [Candidatus Dormibacteraeota bacterium]
MQVTPPIGLAYLYAVLRQSRIEVRAIDAIGEKVDQLIEADGYLIQGLTIDEIAKRIDPQTTIIGVTCMFTQDWPWSRRLIHALRGYFPDALIVAGGEHITALPEFSLRDAPGLDLCVLGEGEETIIEVVRAAGEREKLHAVRGIGFLEDGVYRQTAPRQRIRKIEEIPRPAWDAFPMETYLSTHNAHGVHRGRTMAILSTRGCPYQCTFCSNPVMYGTLWFARQPDDVLDEIQHYLDTYRAENIDFYDLTMILKKDWIIQFCRRIEERGMRFTWQLPTGTRSEVIDDDVSAALYRTGCRNVTYAPESGSPETLKKIKKRVHLGRLATSIRSALRHGINVKVNILLGFPDDTRKSFLQSVLFGWKLALIGVHDGAFFRFSPYPGTELFDELRAEGRIPALDDNYFRSLVALMDPLAVSDYCRNVRGREVALWTLVGMSTFFTLSFLVRPWRLVRLARNVIKDESDTVLAQRLGALMRRPERRRMVAVTDGADGA